MKPKTISLPQIEVLTAVSNEGEVLWAQGVEDGYTYVQISIPADFFSDKEKENFTDYQKECLVENRGIYLGEVEGKDICGKRDLFEIKIVSIPFDITQAVNSKA